MTYWHLQGLENTSSAPNPKHYKSEGDFGIGSYIVWIQGWVRTVRITVPGWVWN